MDSPLDDEGALPPRRRGAPKGNRNAWKHGGRSAAAKLAREAARARVIDRLPDAGLFVRIAGRSEPEIRRLGWDAALAQIQRNKPNNSVARTRGEEGDPPPVFPENKTNNSVAHGSSPAQGRGTTRSVVEGACAPAPLPACGGPSPALRGESHNSVAQKGTPKRGAPKGNKNALKHGFHSAKRRDFDSGLRKFLRRVNAMCKLAHAMASAGTAG